MEPTLTGNNVENTTEYFSKDTNDAFISSTTSDCFYIPHSYTTANPFGHSAYFHDDTDMHASALQRCIAAAIANKLSATNDHVQSTVSIISSSPFPLPDMEPDAVVTDKNNAIFVESPVAFHTCDDVEFDTFCFYGMSNPSIFAKQTMSFCARLRINIT